MQFLLLSLLGLVAGTFSGLIGIGGGIILVPALVYFFGLSQHQAQGTTLTLLIPPIGLLGAWTYYKAGHVDLKIAALICVGFVVGSLVGAKFAVVMPDAILKKVFAVVILLIGVKMLLFD